MASSSRVKTPEAKSTPIRISGWGPLGRNPSSSKTTTTLANENGHELGELRRSARLANQPRGTSRAGGRGGGAAQPVAGPSNRRAPMARPATAKIGVAKSSSHSHPMARRRATPEGARGPRRDGAQGGQVLGLRAVQIVVERCDRNATQPTVADASQANQAGQNSENSGNSDNDSDGDGNSLVQNRVAAPVGLSAMGLRILQLNMGRSKLVTGEVRSLVAEKHLDVLLLQEPYVAVDGQSHTLSGLGLRMQVAAVRSERPWAAVAVCNPLIKMLFISQLSTTHCVCAEVLAPGFSFYVVSHYFQWRDDIEEHLRHLATVLLKLRGKRVLLAVDTNASSTLWGSRVTTEEGSMVERLIQSFDLQVVNEAGQAPTFWTTRSSSFIDVTLVSPAMSQFVGAWKVREDWTQSDHNAIDIRLRIPRVEGNDGRSETSRFNVKRADWDLFSETLTNLSENRLDGLPLTSAAEVEVMAEALTGVIVDACTESMPRKKLFRKSNPWWTRRLTVIKKAVYSKRRALQREQAGPERQEHLQQYRSSLRKYCREVRKARLESWKDFVTSHGNSEPWGFVYKHQARKLRTEKVLSTIRHNGETTMDMRQTASRLLEAHVPEDRVEEDTPQQQEIRMGANIAPETPDTAPFTREGIAKAIRTFKNDKAPGPDLIEVVVLRMAFATIPNQMVRLFNGCLQWGVFPSAWKEGALIVLLKGADKDEKDPKSYRPICLLSVIGKLFEKLLRGRIAQTAMAPGRVSDRQFGFVPGKSTEDAIVELRRMVNESEETYTVALLFDISGAFDNVWWPLVLEALRARECPKNVFEVLQSYFDNRRVKISWNNGEVSKAATRGCPQGSVLGPACWNLMFDGLLRLLEELVPDNFVAYADDLLVLVKGNSRAEIEQRGQHIVNAIDDWCRSAKLQLSERKTEAIVLKTNWVRRAPIGRRGGARPDRQRRRRRERAPDLANRYPAIRLGDTAIGFKNSVRYLGVHFDKNMGVGTHCRYLAEKTGSLFNKLRKLSGRDWGLRFRMLSRVYGGVFVPIVAYAAAGWSDLCTNKQKRILRSAQRESLIAVIGAYRTVSWAASCVVAGVLPVEILLEQQRARYAIRVGRDARINNVDIPGNARNAVAIIKEQAINLWQAQWTSSEKGRTTFAFFNNVRERMNARWFRPDHYSTQALTGHGDFRVRLASLGLVEGVDCSCGLPDTVGHFILECPNFEPQRVALRESIGARDWPEVAQPLVSSEEVFSIFADFCKESLWLKSQEGQAVEV